jgi:hypothetical protein
MPYDTGATDALASLGIEKNAAVVARVRSTSKKNRRYTLRKNDDNYSCTCPDYKYRHAGKGTHCKHITARIGATKTAFDYDDAVSLGRALRKYVLPKAFHREVVGGNFFMPQGAALPTSDAAARQKVQRQPELRPLLSNIRDQYRDTRYGADALFSHVPDQYGRSMFYITPQQYKELDAAAGMKLKDPKHLRMRNAITYGHEYDELADIARPVAVADSYLHNSPSVMLREHNRVTTLPEEMAPVRDYFKAVRGGGVGAGPNEIANSEQQLLFSPLGLTYGESPRLSRHALRRIDEAYARRSQK